MNRIAAFITPHGFGHATRAIAVLQALQLRWPGLAIELFTSVTEHLFRESLTNCTLHRIVPDVGFIQRDALHLDIPETIEALDRLLPFSPELVGELVDRVRGCSCVLCDIAPLGIVVAEAAAIPSVLVENFTWDWMYQPFVRSNPELDRHARTLAEIYRRASLHIQTEPVCNPSATAHCCPPIFRRTTTAVDRVRTQLGAGSRKLILISFGGIDFTLPHWQHLDTFPDCLFVLAGQAGHKRISDNCLALPHDSGFHHQDLLKAADLVVFKSGYSTTAECLQAGTRAACVCRADFSESFIIGDFVRERLGGIILEDSEFLDGRWLLRLPELLALTPPGPAAENGADHVVELICSLTQ